MVSMLAAVPILVIILMIFLVAGIKGKDVDKGGEDLIKNIYLYLVLFATLMMTIGGSVGVFMAAADIVAPVPYHQTFEEFKRWDVPAVEKKEEVNGNTNTLTEEELRERYDAMVLAAEEKQVSRAKNSLIKSLGWIIIPLPIFIYFQRNLVASRAKNKEE